LRRRAPETSRPGLVLVFSGASPAHLTLRAGEGVVELGRASLGKHEDKLMSRQHARVWHDPAGGGWRVEDLASRNGTAVDGRRIVGEVRGNSASCAPAAVSGCSSTTSVPTSSAPSRSAATR
jgi:hypothetical protein